MSKQRIIPTCREELVSFLQNNVSWSLLANLRGNSHDTYIGLITSSWLGLGKNCSAFEPPMSPRDMQYFHADALLCEHDHPQVVLEVETNPIALYEGTQKKYTGMAKWELQMEKFLEYAKMGTSLGVHAIFWQYQEHFIGEARDSVNRRAYERALRQQRKKGIEIALLTATKIAVPEEKKQKGGDQLNYCLSEIKCWTLNDDAEITCNWVYSKGFTKC